MTKLSEDILRLKAEGKTYNEIRAALGCSKGTISYHLGEGQKDKALRRQQDLRSKVRDYVREIKASTPCLDCGRKYPYWVMEFDHIDPALKKFQISGFTRITNALRNVLEEIQKCELVCGNCHKDRTYKRLLENPPPRSTSPANQKQRSRRDVVRKQVQGLKDKPCTDCKVRYPYWVMEFDHLDPSTKSFDVSLYERKVRTFEAVHLEIQKCELVCCNCHSGRTHKRYLASSEK